MTRRLTAMVAAGLTELQGVTVDFWGGPQLQPMASGGPAPLARMAGCTESNWARTGPQGAACRHRRTPAWIKHAQF